MRVCAEFGRVGRSGLMWLCANSAPWLSESPEARRSLATEAKSNFAE